LKAVETRKWSATLLNLTALPTVSLQQVSQVSFEPVFEHRDKPDKYHFRLAVVVLPKIPPDASRRMNEPPLDEIRAMPQLILGKTRLILHEHS
jgi:hypothetical protein